MRLYKQPQASTAVARQRLLGSTPPQLCWQRRLGTAHRHAVGAGTATSRPPGLQAVSLHADLSVHVLRQRGGRAGARQDLRPLQAGCGNEARQADQCLAPLPPECTRSRRWAKTHSRGLPQKMRSRRLAKIHIRGLPQNQSTQQTLRQNTQQRVALKKGHSQRLQEA